MIWAILAVLGVPLWLRAAGITVLMMRNRSLRERPGDIPVRRRLLNKSRWTRGHGLWVHDVFAFRESPATWSSHTAEHAVDLVGPFAGNVIAMRSRQQGAPRAAGN